MPRPAAQRARPSRASAACRGARARRAGPGRVSVGLRVAGSWGDLHLGVIPFYGACRLARRAWASSSRSSWRRRSLRSVPRLAPALRWGGCSLAPGGGHGVGGGPRRQRRLERAHGPPHHPVRLLAGPPGRPAAGIGRSCATYADRSGLPVHVQGHPPGMVVPLRVLDAAGLRGTGVGGRGRHRRRGDHDPGRPPRCRVLLGGDAASPEPAAPFLVLAPWRCSSPPRATPCSPRWRRGPIALVTVAATRRGAHPTLALAGGGALGALTLYFTYGLVPFVVLVRRRRGLCRWQRPRLVRPLVGVAGVAAVVDRRRASGGSTASTPPATATGCGPATTVRTATSSSPTWSCWP